MRLFATLFLSLVTSLTIAQDKVIISSLTNGTPPTKNMASCERNLENLPLNCRQFANLAILSPGGVTSVQPHVGNQLHVYHTEQVGTKARVVRDTFDLSTFTFVTGTTKRFAANLASIQNFSSNDRKGTVQKQPGNVLNRINVNPLGLVFLGPPIPRFPAAPTSAQISDDKNPILVALWPDVNTGKTGVTISNLNPPLAATNFGFTGSDQPRAIDVSHVFDANTSSAHFYSASDDWKIRPDLTFTGLDAPFVRKIGVTNTSGSLQKAAFTPVGKAIPLAPFRRTVRPDAVPFNGVGIDPLAIAIVYLRGNAAQASNDIVLQTFNPELGRKIGPPKLVKRGARGSVNYGISVWNPDFRNGVD